MRDMRRSGAKKRDANIPRKALSSRNLHWLHPGDRNPTSLVDENIVKMRRIGKIQEIIMTIQAVLRV